MLSIVRLATAVLTTAFSGLWPVSLVRSSGSSTVLVIAPKKAAYCAVKIGGKSSQPDGVSR